MATNAGMILAFDSEQEDQRPRGSVRRRENATASLETQIAGCSACGSPAESGSRNGAEEGVRLAYHAAGLSQPERVLVR